MAGHDGGAAVALGDEGLLQEIASGSPEAFERIYHRFYARAYRVAWSVCRDNGRAEEAVQEAFLATWRSASTYRSELGAVSAWLLSMVRYRAIDVARAHGKHAGKRAAEDESVAHSAPGVLADQVVERDSAADLKARLQLLPAAQREVVTLAFYSQLSHTEIALKLQLPPGTVKGRMRLGLERMRTNIDAADVSERAQIALTGALRDGDLDQARHVLRDAIGQMPVVTMLDDVLAPAMHSIGALWEAAEITVADEHLATTICQQLLAEISATLQTAPASSRATVMLVAPPAEQHTLGLLMANAVLHGAGHHTLLLGSGVPAAALNAALLRHQPAVVALSSSMPHRSSLADTATLIHKALPTTHLVTGGATARQLPPNITAHYVERLDGLMATVNALLIPHDRPRPRARVSAPEQA